MAKSSVDDTRRIERDIRRIRASRARTAFEVDDEQRLPSATVAAINAADTINEPLAGATAILDLIERISDGKDLVDLNIDTLSSAARLSKQLVHRAKTAAGELWEQTKIMRANVAEVSHV